MNTLIGGSSNYKIQALVKAFGSIENFPNFQQNLVVGHFSYKAIKSVRNIYTIKSTGAEIAYKEAEALVLAEADKNHKIKAILSNYRSFGKVNLPQKKMILNYLGLGVTKDSRLYFTVVK